MKKSPYILGLNALGFNTSASLFKKSLNQNTEGIYNQYANNKPWLLNELNYGYR